MHFKALETLKLKSHTHKVNPSCYCELVMKTKSKDKTPKTEATVDIIEYYTSHSFFPFKFNVFC